MFYSMDYPTLISIHVPRVEDDRAGLLPADDSRHFNPRPPCGGRRRFPPKRDSFYHISIHVPRVEDDLLYLKLCKTIYTFQSTSPVWRTTVE